MRFRNGHYKEYGQGCCFQRTYLDMRLSRDIAVISFETALVSFAINLDESLNKAEAVNAASWARNSSPGYVMGDCTSLLWSSVREPRIWLKLRAIVLRHFRKKQSTLTSFWYINSGISPNILRCPSFQSRFLYQRFSQQKRNQRYLTTKRVQSGLPIFNRLRTASLNRHEARLTRAEMMVERGSRSPLSVRRHGSTSTW